MVGGRLPALGLGHLPGIVQNETPVDALAVDVGAVKPGPSFSQVVGAHDLGRGQQVHPGAVEVPATINSLQISVPIERRDLLGFGSNYPYEKKLLYPIIGTLSFNGTFDEAVTGDFSNIFSDENNYDFTFGLKKSDGTTGLRIDIFDARVESQSFDLSIGENMTFQSEFSFKIYPEDGMRVSGEARIVNDLLETVEDTINNLISTL